MHRLRSLAWAAIISAPTMSAGAQNNTPVNKPVSTPISFAWPSTFDATTFGSVETCVAMYWTRFIRMNRHAESDTLVHPSALHLRPLPREEANDLRRCAEPFTVDRLLASERVHINAAANMFGMLLMAGRGPEAHALAARWLGSLGASEEDLRHEGIARFFSVAQELRPTRWDDAWAMINLYNHKTNWRWSLDLSAWLMYAAHHKMGDTTQALKAARWIAEITGSLGDNVTLRMQQARAAYTAQKLLLDGPLMDSLSRSTETYVRYLNALQTKVRTANQESFPRADSVQGDYWFPKRPSPGVPSVVIITPDNECKSCVRWVSLLKRAHQRFPKVELLLVTQTRGHYGTVIEPVAPDVEAKLVDSVYRTANTLPATVVIHRTQFVRVDEPDRRRVNLPNPNARSYNTKCDEINLSHGTKAYVVDRAGILIDQFCLKEPFAERRLGRLLGALTSQP